MKEYAYSNRIKTTKNGKKENQKQPIYKSRITGKNKLKITCANNKGNLIAIINECSP